MAKIPANILSDLCSHEWLKVPGSYQEYAQCQWCAALLSFDDLFASYVEHQTLVQTGLAVLTGELEEHRNDLRLAAGALNVPAPQPGTPMARLMCANRSQRREIQALHERAGRLSTGIVKALECVDAGHHGVARLILAKAITEPNEPG